MRDVYVIDNTRGAGGLIVALIAVAGFLWWLATFVWLLAIAASALVSAAIGGLWWLRRYGRQQEAAFERRQQQRALAGAAEPQVTPAPVAPQIVNHYHRDTHLHVNGADLPALLPPPLNDTSTQ